MVYNALTVKDKKDGIEVERVLLPAFFVDVYTAYELFTKQKLNDEQKAGVFLADLRQLAYLAKLSGESVRLAFVVGLSKVLSSRFRAVMDPIDVMLPKVRAALNCVDVVDSDTVGAVYQHHATKNPLMYYNCKGLNHIAKNCSLAKNLSPKKIFRCFKCGNKGHIASKCFKVAGKRLQERGICATSLLNNSGISALTIIHLKVNGIVATAIVDTGCSKTILNQNFLSKNQHKCLNSPKVVTFEGKVHQCIGSEVVRLMALKQVMKLS